MSATPRVDWNPPRKILRDFGWIALAGFSLVALLAWNEWLVFRGVGSWREGVSFAALGLGALAALCSLVHPPANRPLFVGLSVLTYPIGWVLSHVLVAALFFGLFAPIALVFRVIGRDTMRRGADPDAESYWEPARPTPERSRYFRQF